jgi:hypothetical protein
MTTTVLGTLIFTTTTTTTTVIRATTPDLSWAIFGPFSPSTSSRQYNHSLTILITI